VVEDGEVRPVASVTSFVDVDVETQIVCRLREAPEFLGRLVLSTAVGHDREWEEGYVAMKVTDDRQPPSFRPPGTDKPTPCDTTRPLRAVVSWKPVAGVSRSAGGRVTGSSPAQRAVAESSVADHAAVQDATIAMFKSAGWPFRPDGDPWVPHPWPVLLRMETLELEAKASLPCLTEKEEGAVKVKADWHPEKAAWACDVTEPSGECGSTRGSAVGVAPLDARRARLELSGFPDTSVRRARVDLTVSADRLSATQDFHTTVWSHGFRADYEEWLKTSVRLCQELPEITRQDPAACSETPVTAEMAHPGWLPGRQEVERLLSILAGDKVMTMTELSTLVREVCRLCGRTTPSGVQEPLRFKPAQSAK